MYIGQTLILCLTDCPSSGLVALLFHSHQTGLHPGKLERGLGWCRKHNTVQSIWHIWLKCFFWFLLHLSEISLFTTFDFIIPELCISIYSSLLCSLFASSDKIHIYQLNLENHSSYLMIQFTTSCWKSLCSLVWQRVKNLTISPWRRQAQCKIALKIAQPKDAWKLNKPQ